MATTLVELAQQSGAQFEIVQEKVPVKPVVAAGCDILGLDPLYLANEGKILVFAKPDKEKEIMSVFKNHPLGRHASLIGRVASIKSKGMVLLETGLGVKRILTMLESEHLPRIC